VEETKAKYSICDKDVYNFDEAGFMMGKDFLEELQGWTHAKLEYQRFSPYMKDKPGQVEGQRKRRLSGHMSVEDFCARLDQRRSAESAQRLCCGEYMQWSKGKCARQ
jgi:hypothetical protein